MLVDVSVGWDADDPLSNEIIKRKLLRSGTKCVDPCLNQILLLLVLLLVSVYVFFITN